MLADTARQFVPQRFVFNLGKNEPFPVRFAQAEFLLDSGLKPERIFVVIIPLDVLFARHALDQYGATRGGALVYAPRLPPVGGGLVQNSRLALKAWTRTRLHQNLTIPVSTDRVHPAVRADLQTVFGHFAEATKRHGVPVTVVLLPDYQQVFGTSEMGLQATIPEDARAASGSTCATSARRSCAWPNKPGACSSPTSTSPTPEIDCYSRRFSRT